jgi:probable HAF family extracellular repeat protein
MKIVVTIAAISWIAATASAQNKPQYTVVDLGTLGGAYSYSYGVNNAGVVAGGAATASQTGGVQQTGFLWSKGVMTPLGTLGGSSCPSCSSEAGGPNAAGVSALISDTALMDPDGQDFCGFGSHRQCLGAVWRDGKLEALQPLTGGFNSQAYWINSRGQVIGFSETGVTDTTCNAPQVKRFTATIWDARRNPRALSPLSGDTVSFGFGINNLGQAVGTSGSCAKTVTPPNAPSGEHAVLWNANGTVTLIDTSALPGAAPNGNNIATSINDRGDVVGTAEFADGTIHSFLWSDGRIRDLGMPDGDFVAVAGCCSTLNNRGEVVGFAFPGPTGDGHAILWLANGPVDLNTLVPAGSPFLTGAYSINDAGEIAAGAIVGGEFHAVLLRPVPAVAVKTNQQPPAAPSKAQKMPKARGNFAR